ncbi:MAG TPA: TIGR01244 family phosphatase [Rhodobacteraceae bacterium]|nr:TIGR01244 family phosphatase [Paracoccaceae bacterium]
MLFNLFKPKNTLQVGGLKVTELDPNYTATGQISVADVADIKAAGFNTVMCNRPDGEAPGQPAAAQIQRAVEKAGMKFFYVPMGRSLAPNTLGDFKAVTDSDNGKVFAYCRSGNRCTILWKTTRS